jgi:hypothetical protein
MPENVSDDFRKDMEKDSADRAAMARNNGRTGRHAHRAERAKNAAATAIERQYRKEAERHARLIARIEAKGVKVTLDNTLKPENRPEPTAYSVPAAATRETLAEKRGAQASAAMVELASLESGWIRAGEWEDLPFSVQIIFLEGVSLEPSLEPEVISLNLARLFMLQQGPISRADWLKLEAAKNRLRSLQYALRPSK